MATLIFLWYMLTIPADRILCTLWTAEPPGPEALRAACGFQDLGKYRLDLVPLNSGEPICSRPGDSLSWIRQDCRIIDTLDHYTVRIVQPQVTELICSITVEHAGQPTAHEINDQCDGNAWPLLTSGRAVLKLVKQTPKQTQAPTTCSAPVLAAGFGIYDQAPDAHGLWSDDPLAWLGGRLIWFGVVRPQCEGGTSGLDPQTLAADGCGIAGARLALTAWQNQFDGDIFNAAITYRVPARLLKRIIKVESQYWPLWSDKAGEHGMLQVSENGVDVLLRYDPGLDPEYPRRPKDAQLWKRMEVMTVLACAYCSLDQAVIHAHQAIQIYARLLAAYRCRAVEMNPGLSGAAAWQQAVIDYNGDPGYLRKVEG